MNDLYLDKTTQDLEDFSSLVDRFNYYIDLSLDEERLLRNLEKGTLHFKARVKLHLQDFDSSLYVVKSGWIYQYADLHNGQRKVLKIYLPGDIVGLDDLVLEASLNDTMTASEVIIAPFKKENLEDLFSSSPRLSSLIFSLSMLDKAILMDRLKMSGRASALVMVANFMLELHSRLKLHIKDGHFDTFKVPLTQSVIADTLGLTNVTVSNAFSQLDQDGKITWFKRNVTIHDPEQLKIALGFNDRHFQIDTSWFPFGHANLYKEPQITTERYEQPCNVSLISELTAVEIPLASSG